MSSQNPATQSKFRVKAPFENAADRMVAPVSQFASHQIASGALLGVALVAALALANSRFADAYAEFQHLHLSISFAQSPLDMTLVHWMNDGLMVLFFFLLGLEIKRELIAGELQDLQKSTLVLCMAVGGMLAPAVIYLSINGVFGAQASQGWGIPMATDTAFALGILAVLGSRVPPVAAVLLSALAIVDDIGAVLVIGIFYTEEIIRRDLFLAIASLVVLVLLNLSGVRRPLPYALFGISLWWWTLQSGIHSTIAGVLAAFAVPTRPYLSTGAFLKRMPQLLKRYKAAEELPGTVMEDEQKKDLLMQTEQLASNSITPLQRWEGALYKPIMLFVVPVFAFLNAGIAMPASIDQLTGSVIALAIAAALFLGKTLGICALAWLGVRAGLASLPDSVNFRHIVGLASLAGIGFTMSLFVSVLAFGDTPALMREAKLGILLGSLLAAISGTSILLWANSRQRTE